MALTLVNMRVGPFAGIAADRPIVIEFPKVNAKTRKRPISKLTGDQGLGKSSFIHFLLYATAQKFGIKQQDLVNIDSDKLNGEIQFKQKDETWKVVVTKTTFKLYRFFEVDGDHGWIPQGNEAENLRNLIGTVAISPMKLKTDNGQNQVDWLFKMLNVPDDIVNEARRLGNAMNEAAKVRARANEDYEHLYKTVTEDPMYLNWEESEKKYAEVKTVDSLKAKLETATKNKAKLVEAREKVAGYQRRIVEKDTEIKELEEKLTRARLERKTLQGGKDLGEKWIGDNEKVEAEYEEVQKEFITLSQFLSEQNAWGLLQQKKREMDEFETLVQDADNSKGRLRKQKSTLLKNILKDVDDVEVMTHDEIGGKKTGIYIDGKNPMQLSESELFDFYFKLCRIQGVTMVVIENITSFGTSVVNTLNELSRAGVYVWATEMHRGQEDLRIEFIDKIQ